MFLQTLLLAALATALPTATTNSTSTPYTDANNTTPQNLINFYLLTTTSSTRNTNSSLLPSASPTSLFDPLSQTTYLLRLIGPGYNSLPQFNLTEDGTLETEAAGPHGIGEFEYNSTRVRAGEDLMFEAKEQGKGNLGLVDGYLLSVGGEVEGWRICEGDLGQQVVSACSFYFSGGSQRVSRDN
jgi:hypothetical protein